MCQSSVFVIKDGEEELVMKDVSTIKPGANAGELLLEGILGEQKVFQGRLKELQLMDHKILVEAFKTL